MNEHRLREGLEHLQSAALELIEASRAFLDIAEELVRDPAEVSELPIALARAIVDLSGARGEDFDGDSGSSPNDHNEAARGSGGTAFDRPIPIRRIDVG